MSRSSDLGKFGEQLAEKYLKEKSYEIIGKNVRYGHLEFDLIANFKEKVVFIEVKTRLSSSLVLAQDSFSRKKLQLLKKAIQIYMERHNINDEQIRLDLVAIDLDKYKKIAKIKHFKDIF